MQTPADPTAPGLARPRRTARISRWFPWPYQDTPILYLAIRLLFKFVLRVFYASIVIEGEHFVPLDGVPALLCANHSNSLTDPLILATAIPLCKRRLLRLTAKSTLFGLRNFSSWLIESVGTVPIKRAKDFNGAKVDNSVVFGKLMDALDKDGDLVCLFPEGISHYHSYVMPLRSGVSRIAADVLKRNANNPDFKITLITCSITYLHREAFRSDVLVRFNPPVELSVREHGPLFGIGVNPERSVDNPHEAVRQLTELMSEQIRQGTIDAPDFGTVRIGHVARRLYAPLGTGMTLGDTVQITQRFIDVFASRAVLPPLYTSYGGSADNRPVPPTPGERLLATATAAAATSQALSREGSTVSNGSSTVKKRVATNAPGEIDYFALPAASDGKSNEISEGEIEQLKRDLHAYQDTLNHLGLKDDRVRRPPIATPILLKRLLVRLSGAACLGLISLPGLVCWLPIFATAKFFSWRVRSSGKLEDVWDEIAHTKLLYGLASGCAVWLLSVLATFPLAPVTFLAFPAFMWLSLRWLEDALSSLRAGVALLSLLLIGRERLSTLRAHREALHARVLRLATERAELPADIGVWLEKERRAAERGGKVGRLGYFSIRRRRKKDYNEVLRLWDKTEYAQ